jgi:Tol biopolymer transport system component
MSKGHDEALWSLLLLEQERSPDGATLPFSSTRDGTMAAYVAKPDGSGVTRLLPGVGGNRSFGIS